MDSESSTNRFVLKVGVAVLESRDVSNGRYDIAVIGGGIIGLSTALLLVEQFPRQKVVIVEKEDDIALHQTGHNSGVIHSGIYYAPGSSKANFCSTGGQMLRSFCEKHGVRYEMCGKVVVATDETEVPLLMELHERGSLNGVTGLEVIGPERLRELEPNVIGVRAIHSTNTGIVDYRAVAEALANELQARGGELITGVEVVGVEARDGDFHIRTTADEVCTGRIINCAGLYADKLARKMGLQPRMRIVPFRGEFFSLSPESSNLVNGLIYPVPNPQLPFLGVHFTRRLDGTVEAGPNAVLALAQEGYRNTDFNVRELWGLLSYGGFWKMARTHWRSGINEQYRSMVKGKFVRSVQTLVPDVRKDDLVNRSAGVRAQAVDRQGQILQDFAILHAKGSIHVLNAPSPAATACLAIGQHIVGLARESFGLAA